MQTKQTLYVGVIIALIVIAGISIWVSSHHKTGSSYPMTIADRGQIWQQENVMTQGDFIQMQNIRKGIHQTRMVSDEDVNWLLMLLQKPTSHPELVDPMVCGILARVANFTPPQQQKILPVVAPLLTQSVPSDTYHNVPYAAALLLGSLGDKDAIPYLAPLLQSSDAALRQRAQRSLSLLGYTGS